MSLPSSLLDHTPWENETNPLWPASSFILHRNLANYLFPPKITAEQANLVLNLLSKEFPNLLQADKTSLLDKEFIYEHFLCLESLQNTLSGQAFYIDPTAEILALFNIDDHLRIQLFDTKGEWEKAFSRLAALDAQLSSKIEFAFSSRFGYLTSDPTLCGTGLIVLAYLHLPALIHTKQLQETLLKQKEEEVFATSLQGNLEDIVGDMVILTNEYTLGVTEENILHSINVSAMKLIGSEKALRSRLIKENNAEIKDQISRAYGLLLHSYQLKTQETLNALSLIKLGLDLGYVKGITDKKINEIFFKCRRAHLAYASSEKTLDPQDLSHKRAAFIHEQLASVQLD